MGGEEQRPGTVIGRRCDDEEARPQPEEPPLADEEEYIDVSECAFCVSNNKTGEGEKGPGAPATAPLREKRLSAASRRLPLTPASVGARRGAQGRGGRGSWRRARCGAAGLPHPQQSAAAGRRDARGAQLGGAHRARPTACAINLCCKPDWLLLTKRCPRVIGHRH